ncbi:MAG: hypothetical protein EOO92_04500 [Pedobacter sp.]|nr:MAG: hypothetical protein EOO92_04500 [Pedobacter sp.]
MKTSTKLVVASMVLALVMLACYNYSLKAEYKLGKYKDRFNMHTFVKASGITGLRVNAIDLINVRVETGAKEGLWIKTELKDKIKVAVNGDQLVLSWIGKDKDDPASYYGSDVILIANQLNTVAVNAYFNVIEKRFSWQGKGLVELVGISGAKMDMDIGEYCGIEMVSTNFDRVSAKIGSDTVGATLSVDRASGMGKGYFDIPGPGELKCSAWKINESKFKVTKLATVSITGRLAQHLNN